MLIGLCFVGFFFIFMIKIKSLLQVAMPMSKIYSYNCVMRFIYFNNFSLSVNELFIYHFIIFMISILII